MNYEEIKRHISIRAYLAARGIKPRWERGNRGMYLSPLRKERTASFSVSYDKNLWHDFGTGEGGSIIDLVARMEGCSEAEAARRLWENKHGTLIPIYAEPSRVSEPTPSRLAVLSDRELTHPALLGYLTGRGIDPAIARTYCREVRYTIGGKEYFAIGFRNDAGGWELRSARFKGGSSPKHITTIDNQSDTVIAFEGFMDFLAYLSLKYPERLRIDAAVLNSVVNLPKAVPFISRHPVIHAFFDNDEAGRKTTADLLRLCPRSEIIDQSHFYRGHKDVNDYLTARIKGRTQKPSTQKNASETKAVQALRNNLQALKAETEEIEPPRRKGVKI